ncbi:MAG TPA: hypothetical protein DCX89_01775 [Saprospirales bacterium]|nr:hypothetical protein [Saprospirales bacterium]HAY70596.1 hypothetical protein [Saprospirales bacterium]HRQ30260.1 hypothetical protein [Saprospiraceae bacterium]
MKKYFFVFLATMIIILGGCKQKGGNMDPDAPQKEVMNDVKAKTYIVQFKTEVRYKDLENVSTSTQWIDMVNDRMAIETESESNLMGKSMKSHDLTIIVNDEAWLINLEQKTGYKAGKSSILNENQSEIIRAEDDATFRQKIEESGGKIVGEEAVLGKNCLVIELPDPSGKSAMKTRLWYYNGVPLKMKNDFYDMEAVDIQENVKIPEDIFKVPAGIKMQDFPG